METFGSSASVDPFEMGVRAGLDRSERTGLMIPERWEIEELVERRLALTRDLLRREEASARFTELFAEMMTVAAVARHVYGDSAVSRLGIKAYLRHSASIFNSFRHA